jgi:transposase
MSLTAEQLVELESVIRVGYDGSVSALAQIVLQCAAGHPVAEVAKMNATTRPTVDKWVERFAEGGLAALEDRVSSGRPPSVSTAARSRIIALTRMGPPAQTGLTHWSSYEMARYLRGHENIDVSHNFIAALWRDNDLKPHRQGTFKVSRDPDFSAKVVDIVGLYLDPPAGAVVLSFDEKTQVRRCSAPSRCCQSTSARPRSAPTTTAATAPRTCSRPSTSSPAGSPAAALTGAAPPSS